MEPGNKDNSYSVPCLAEGVGNISHDHGHDYQAKEFQEQGYRQDIDPPGNKDPGCSGPHMAGPVGNFCHDNDLDKQDSHYQSKENTTHQYLNTTDDQRKDQCDVTVGQHYQQSTDESITEPTQATNSTLKVYPGRACRIDNTDDTADANVGGTCIHLPGKNEEPENLPSTSTVNMIPGNTCRGIDGNWKTNDDDDDDPDEETRQEADGRFAVKKEEQRYRQEIDPGNKDPGYPGPHMAGPVGNLSHDNDLHKQDRHYQSKENTTHLYLSTTDDQGNKQSDVTVGQHYQNLTEESITEPTRATNSSTANMSTRNTFRRVDDIRRNNDDDDGPDVEAGREADEYFAGRKKAREKYEFFWKKHSAFSQWHDSTFYVDDKKFICAEQFMMYSKAVLFKDDYAARKILETKSPAKMKSWGRKVKGFTGDKWSENCLHVVKQASIAKFTQNEYLKKKLLATYPRILVEASPLDKIWGIGCDEDDPLAWYEATWQGENFLGYILTEVRDELLCETGFLKAEEKKLYLEDLQKKLTEERNQEQEVYARHKQEMVDQSDATSSQPFQGSKGSGLKKNHPGAAQRLADIQESGSSVDPPGRNQENKTKQHTNDDTDTVSKRREACTKYEFFNGPDSPFSLWHKSQFLEDGKMFTSVKQHMMYKKAKLFDDVDTADKILQSESADTIEQLGRRVENFQQDVWNANYLHIVKDGVIAKFSHSDQLRKQLTDTYPKILVKADPKDYFWGIGLVEDEPRAWDETSWQGGNILGFILTEVRDEFLCDDDIIQPDDKKVFFDRLLQMISHQGKRKPNFEEQKGQKTAQKERGGKRNAKSPKHGQGHGRKNTGSGNNGEYGFAEKMKNLVDFGRRKHDGKKKTGKQKNGRDKQDFQKDENGCTLHGEGKKSLGTTEQKKPRECKKKNKDKRHNHQQNREGKNMSSSNTEDQETAQSGAVKE